MRTLEQILQDIHLADSGLTEVARLQELRSHEDYQKLLSIVQHVGTTGFFLENVRHEIAGRVLGPSLSEQNFCTVKWMYCAGLLHGQRLRGDGDA